MRSPKRGNPVNMNKMEGQKQSQDCQHSYKHKAGILFIY